MSVSFRSAMLIAAIAVFSFSVAAQPVWSPEVQITTRGVGTPRVSPDGKQIVYTVTSAVMAADKSEYLTQIYLANTDGTNTRQITFGDKSSTNPKWSPDGSSIAFTSTRKDNRNNIYLLRLGGGDAEPLTDLKSSVSNFEWSPDGNWIAYLMTDPKNEDEEKNDRGRNDFRWVDENVKMSRLYVMPLTKDTAGKREARKLTTENYNVTNMDWSPDGKQIIFAHVKSAVVDHWSTSNVSIANVASGKVTAFAATPAAENTPTYSPDGKSIAIVLGEDPPRWAWEYKISIYPAGGGAPKAMTASFDSLPTIVGWSADSKKIYFTEANKTTGALYVMDVAANKITELTKDNGLVNAVSLNQSGDMLSFVMQGTAKPQEVYVSRTNIFAPVRISRVNEHLEKLAIAKTELIKWKSTDGREIEGLLTYPLNYQPGTKVPLLLNVHGGPASVFSQAYIGGVGSYPLATFATRGYAILRPNPRGSSGYGIEFRRANMKDWGGADYQDLMTGVDKVIEMGVADANRLGVMGWSYGGFMTSTIITKTKRFKAASAGAPVTNLMSFNGTADVPSFVPDYFSGQSWDNIDTYMKHSAMFNIKGVITPTLIQHGDADIRVPISQGYELYNALKQQGVPTRMLVLPRQPHGPNEPKMQIAAMQSNLDWFEKYLK